MWESLSLPCRPNANILGTKGKNLRNPRHIKVLVDCSVNNSTNCVSARHLVSCGLIEKEQQMRGRYPFADTLKTADRRQLEQVAGDGQVLQRVAKRAQALLALDRGNGSWRSCTGRA